MRASSVSAPVSTRTRQSSDGDVHPWHLSAIAPDAPCLAVSRHQLTLHVPDISAEPSVDPSRSHSTYDVIP